MTQDERMNLVRKVGLFGLKDLRKLAPIGDLGYMNGWYATYRKLTWVESQLPIAIIEAFYEQGFKCDKVWDTGYRKTDHHYRCSELGLSWSVDSGD